MGKCIIRIYDEDTGELLQKQCTQCGQVKDVSEFGKTKKHSDGLRSNCKICVREYKESNKGKIKEYMKEYRKTDKWKEYYKEYNKEYYKNNKEYFKKYKKERYENNKEHYKKYKKEHRQTPEGRAAMKRKNHKRRLKVNDNGGTWTLEQWNQCLEYFNNCDAYTGESLTTTEIEHVIPISKGGTSNIYNIVPANKSTNCSKGNKDLFEWYSQQPYFSWERYLKICMWIIKNGGAIE